MLLPAQAEFAIQEIEFERLVIVKTIPSILSMEN